MTKTEAVLVRCYITESRSHIPQLLLRLSNTEELRGITITEARAGIGTTDLPDGVVDVPIILECFERASRADEIVRILRRLVAPRHILVIPATLYDWPAK